ncbi:hypothetical protein TNCT_198581 [Trichonephila clavata]|uniref:Uncharacterized protein n=1 Tax=Trichonephila clavata TaxID=2740835 RepID=A0A8X6IHK3_TRICU|nr:hypothetical protein TNCT_198581 [Trichonephila clavata]
MDDVATTVLLEKPTEGNSTVIAVKDIADHVCMDDQEKSPEKENEELVNDAETKKSPPEIVNISENKIRALNATIQQATPKNHLTLNMLNAVEAEVDDENQLEYDNGDDS